MTAPKATAEHLLWRGMWCATPTMASRLRTTSPAMPRVVSARRSLHSSRGPVCGTKGAGLRYGEEIPELRAHFFKPWIFDDC
jgi:hypothetical protein